MILRMIALIIILSQGYAKEVIPNDQAIILNKFFRYLLEETEAGYVLHGEKPLCQIGYLPKDFFSAADEHHQSMVILGESARLWKNLQTDSNDIIIHISEPLNVSGFHEVIVLNRPLFLKTVADNINLYRYILGPQVSPEYLLSEMLRTDTNFSSVLKDNDVLIGISLGYGTQNSIHHSRILDLQENLLTTATPPFKTELMKVSEVHPSFLHGALIGKKAYHPQKKLSPFQKFATLDDEFKSLNKQLLISSEKLEIQKPLFIFGHINDSESIEFVKRLESSQEKIKTLLKSDNLLKSILQNIAPNIEITQVPSSETLELTPEQKDRIPFLIAANMWDDINDENLFFQDAYIEGCKACQQGILLDPNKKETNNYRKLVALKNINEKLNNTNRYFDLIDKHPDYKSIFPKKLYIKTAEIGSGSILENQSKLTVKFVCKNSKNEVLSDCFCSEPMEIDLAETITGFNIGVKGMHIGEIREMIIHPTLTYGVLTPAEKGDYLWVRVQLIDFDKNSSLPINQQTQILEIPPFVEDDYQKESKMNGFVRGYKAWQHYSKDPNLSLEQILVYLEQLRKGNAYDISDEQSQATLNRLHWNLYFTKQ